MTVNVFENERDTGLGIRLDDECPPYNHLDVADLLAVAAPERVTRFAITAWRIRARLDVASIAEALARFTNVETLVVSGIDGAHDLQAFFPKLRALNFTHRPSTFTALAESWPHLERLTIEAFRGDLADLGPHPRLRYLTLAGLNTDSFAPLRGYPNLEALEILWLRKRLDVAPLADLPKLKQLAVTASSLQSGWDDLVLAPTVQSVAVNRLPSWQFIENNPQVNSFAAKEIGELRLKDLKQRGWIDRGDYGRELRRDPAVIGRFTI